MQNVFQCAYIQLSYEMYFINVFTYKISLWWNVFHQCVYIQNFSLKRCISSMCLHTNSLMKSISSMCLHTKFFSDEMYFINVFTYKISLWRDVFHQCVYIQTLLWNVFHQCVYIQNFSLMKCISSMCLHTKFLSEEMYFINVFTYKISYEMYFINVFTFTLSHWGYVFHQYVYTHTDESKSIWPVAMRAALANENHQRVFQYFSDVCSWFLISMLNLVLAKV